MVMTILDSVFQRGSPVVTMVMTILDSVFQRGGSVVTAVRGVS